MSAGTIDNYSVSLVQRKAGWIDQLLKTKSNVFVNPNDENYIDADELLLALTEEWGDSSKAEERRKEMEKVKEAKLIEAQNQKRKEQLASLSLLRGSLISYSGDKGKISYQNRLQKIAMLEKSLCENPSFTEHTLVKTSIPFLYGKGNDTVIRKGDVVISQGKPYEVTVLNFKRCEFTACPVWEGEIKNDCSDRNIVMPVNGFKEKRASAYIAQPSKDERKLLTAIHTGGFYSNVNNKLQEKYYHLHLVCAAYNECLPPIFSIGNDGKLVITEERYYAYRDPDTINI
jgi:hypothetical protein